MAGNRRFGKKRHADAMQGHWDGGKKLVECVEWSMLHGVQILTVFAFSTENWSRERDEVDALMTIIAKYTETVKEEALARNVKVKILSTDLERLPPQVRHAVVDLETATAACSAFRLNVCLNYGARQEITAACRHIAQRALNGEISASCVDEAMIEQELLTAGLPGACS
jgi:undecaprenyl diphosphate synthase